jgi:xanthine/CO dehydrogenase XdhC/CoxF family maturation factor
MEDGIMSEIEPKAETSPELEDVLGLAAAWRAAGEDVALATVTETWGSSPRPAGSRLAVTLSGRMAGSVSGGCIEGAVAEAAAETIRTGRPQLLDFGVSNERAWEVGLACGGKVKVFVEKLA